MKEINIKSLMEFLKNSGEQDESSTVKLTEADSDSNFDDIGFDSLSLLNVVEQLKQQFGISIAYEQAVAAKTPNALLALI